MLITHLRAKDLPGKKVYDARGRVLGQVVAVLMPDRNVKAIALLGTSAPRHGSAGVPSR